MEPTTQLIRLSIPGSIFVLAGVGTYAFAQVLWENSLSEVESLSTITTSITAIAASIPLGFLIYQIYYWRYSPFVVGNFVTRDRGRDALWHLSPEVLRRLRSHFDARLDVRRHHRTVSTPVVRRLKLLRLHDDLLRARYKDKSLAESEEDKNLFEKDNRSLRRIYRDNWYENWDVFRSVLDLVASEGGRPEIKRDFMTLYDLYHALGAGRLAVPLGTGAGVVYLALAHGQDISANAVDSIVGLFCVATVACLVAYVLHQTRIATWKSAISKVRLELTACLSPASKLVRGLGDGKRFTRRKDMRRPSEQHSRPHRRPFFRKVGTRVAKWLLDPIGSSGWVEETRGVLDKGGKRRYRGAVLFATLVEAPRTLTGRFRRRNLGPDPSDVALPESAYIERLKAECGHVEPMVWNHGVRSYIFGRALGWLERSEGYSPEALFSATMLHARTFSSITSSGDGCFTSASVEFAREFLQGSHFEDNVIEAILDAISLYLNPAVGPPYGVLQHLTHDGILLDMLGVRAWELDREGMERVLGKFPRVGLTAHVDEKLRCHSKLVPNGRVAGLYGAGFGPVLKLSRWWGPDNEE